VSVWNEKPLGHANLASNLAGGRRRFQHRKRARVLAPKFSLLAYGGMLS
jgi:hypothetical protein